MGSAVDSRSPCLWQLRRGGRGDCRFHLTRECLCDPSRVPGCCACYVLTITFSPGDNARRGRSTRPHRWGGRGEGHGSQPVWLERPPSHAQRGAGHTQTGTQHPGMWKLCDPGWPKGRQWPEVPPGELSSDWVGGLGRRGCGRDPDPHWAEGQADAGGWQDEAPLSKSLPCVQRLPDTCHRYHEHPPLGSPSGCLEPGPPGSELAGSSVLDRLSLRCTRGLWELGRLHRDPGREGWARDKNPMDRAGSDTPKARSQPVLSSAPSQPVPKMGGPRREVSGPGPAQGCGQHCSRCPAWGPGSSLL